MNRIKFLREERGITTIELGKKIGVTGSAHQLRHTYACILHKANIPLKEAQYFMGHKDLSVLMNIYTHLDEEDKEIARKKLNKKMTSF